MSPIDNAEPEHSVAEHRVVVGVDGSVASERAFEWATRHAQLSGSVLDIVTAWVFPMALGYALTTTVDEVRRRARDLVDQSVTFVTEVAPEVTVRGEETEQSPGPALVRAGQGADLLVVGSRGNGGFHELMVGSVGSYCASHATCSVVIVR